MTQKNLFSCLVIAFLAFALSACAIPYVTSDERDANTHTTDIKIQNAIKSELLMESPGKALNVNVYSFAGHVYLLGDVDVRYRGLAEKIARSTAGVKRVSSHWFAVGSADRLTDTRIENSINTNLLFARGVSSTQVNVDVWGGHVVLLGLMANQSDIDRAVREAEGIEGVKSVTNNLTVYAPGR